MSAHNGRLFLHTCAECEHPTDNRSMICDDCAPLYDPVKMQEDIDRASWSPGSRAVGMDLNAALRFGMAIHTATAERMKGK